MSVEENMDEVEIPVVETPAPKSAKVPTPPPMPKVELVDFETWHSTRAKMIPTHHYKEILMADFKARKTPAKATMAEFDEALKKYGVKLPT